MLLLAHRKVNDADALLAEGLRHLGVDALRRQAERLGISPAEVREREAEARYSRGELLKRSGAAGAAVALSGPVAFASAARGVPMTR